jgi:Ca2+:H+ antiporter
VSSINGITKGSVISKSFIRLILLPIVRNATEHVTAVIVVYKDKIDLTIRVAIGSSIQIGLFVLTLIVILS